MTRRIVGGRIAGTVLKSDLPINFLGTVDKKTGTITDGSHPLYGKSVAGIVLVFPHGIGSSVGAYTIYSLYGSGAAPAAMVCKKADLTVASGCALANIPLALVSEEEFAHIEDGSEIRLDE